MRMLREVLNRGILEFEQFLIERGWKVMLLNFIKIFLSREFQQLEQKELGLSHIMEKSD